jgi:hypothetical protein
MSDVINRRDSPFLRIEMPLRGLLVSSFVAESVKIILKVCHNVDQRRWINLSELRIGYHTAEVEARHADWP